MGSTSAPPADERGKSALPLRTATLPDLPASVDPPRYDRAHLVPSVVHIGVGNFHRAHQAVHFDELARRGDLGWGVVGVNLHSRRTADVLTAQDGLYTVLVRGPERDEPRVVGSLTRTLFAPDDPAAVLAALTDPRLRLVTLTITGAAYLAGDEDGPAPAGGPDGARTAFEHLVDALDHRRRSGLAPFAVLSCDNVPGNGRATRDAVVWTARRRSASLAAWIEERTAFPGGVVDRITPRTAPADCEDLAARHGVRDAWPVVTEPFRQWIVEDDFRGPRPPLEEVGVRFVADAHPHELLKTRVLNGAHSALGHVGQLAGFTTGDAALRDPAVRAFVRAHLAEAAAVLPPVPGTDVAAYRRTVLERLSSPRLGDQLPRLCRRGSTKITSFVLPSLQLALEAGTPSACLALTVAAWIRSLRGVDAAGRAIEVEDPLLERLRPLALACTDDPRPLLARPELLGPAGADPRTAAAVGDALRLLDAGPLAAADAAARLSRAARRPAA